MMVAPSAKGSESFIMPGAGLRPALRRWPGRSWSLFGSSPHGRARLSGNSLLERVLQDRTDRCTDHFTRTAWLALGFLAGDGVRKHVLTANLVYLGLLGHHRTDQKAARRD